jgi:hypothetical protein
MSNNIKLNSLIFNEGSFDKVSHALNFDEI